MRIRKKDFEYYSGKKYDGMMGRCYRLTDRSYKYYGAKGIKVCSEWINDIESFRTWLIKELLFRHIGIEEFVINHNKYQLDRIVPKGHYTPDNCRIISRQKNSRNTRITKGKTIVSAEGEVFIFGN